MIDFASRPQMAEPEPYTFAAVGNAGDLGGFGAPMQPMRQQQTTSGPLAYPNPYPGVQLSDQPYNGPAFRRQTGQQEVYSMQDLGIPADVPRRPGSAGTGHDTLPGIAGVGAPGSVTSPGPGPGQSAARGNGLSALVGAAGLTGGAVAAAAAAAAGATYRNQRE